jgi:hypothetical protein
MVSLMRRLKQRGVLCGTEYLDERCDGLTSSTGDDALHNYQRCSGATQYFLSTCLHLWGSSLVQRFKQNGVVCGTEYINKRCDGLTSLTIDDALHKYQRSSGAT